MIPPNEIVRLLEEYGYLFLFVSAVVEGPIVTIVGAFLASQGYFNVFAVYAVVVSGDLTGDLLFYAIGRFGRNGSFARMRNALGMTGERFLSLERYVQEHGVQMLLLAKFTQIGFLILPASGAARMPVGKFIWYNVLATLPKSFALLVVGYFFGYAYIRIDGYFAKASLLVFGTFCLAGVYLIVRHYVRTHYEGR